MNFKPRPSQNRPAAPDPRTWLVPLSYLNAEPPPPGARAFAFPASRDPTLSLTDADGLGWVPGINIPSRHPS